MTETLGAMLTVAGAFALTALFGIVTGVIGGYGLRGRPLPFIPFLAAGYAAGGFIWPG